MQETISQCDDVLPIFNHFFDNLPKQRSYDMAFRVYLRDLADVEDRSALLSTKSLADLTHVQPTCISAYGRITPSIQSTRASFSLSKKDSSSSVASADRTSSGIASISTLSSQMSKIGKTEKDKEKTLKSPEIRKEKKPRSLMSLNDANRMLSQPIQKKSQKSLSTTSVLSQSSFTRSPGTLLSEKKESPILFKKPLSMVNLYEANQLPMPSKKSSATTRSSTSNTQYENINMQPMPTLISTISTTSTTDLTGTSNISFSKDGWTLIESKKQKYSDDLKIEFSDLF